MLQGHAQGPQTGGGTERVGTRPAHHAPAVQIQYHGRIEPALVGAYIGQVADPRFVRPDWGRSFGQPVRGDGFLVIALRRPGHETSRARTAQRVLPHKSGHALAAAANTPGAQLPMMPRRAVASAMPLMLFGDRGRQFPIAAFPFARSGLAPGVIARTRHVQRCAQLGHGMLRAHDFDPFVAGFDGSERIPSVFFRMSRCSRTRINSARNCRFSVSRSDRCGIASP